MKKKNKSQWWVGVQGYYFFLYFYVRGGGGWGGQHREDRWRQRSRHGRSGAIGDADKLVFFLFSFVCGGGREEELHSGACDGDHP